MQKALQYLSCQTCHKPAGDRHTKDTGTCFDCEREIIAAGHRREEEKETAQWYTCAMSEAERQEVIGRSRLSYGLAPSWDNLTEISREAIRARRRNVIAEGKRIEREAEERTRIGNTPSCDEWPTCKHCGSNLADDDDVEAEVCDACQRDPYRWKTRTATA
ncbi:MAG: hypothetical protein ACLQVL_36695 [Terriglobia bacterium]